MPWYADLEAARDDDEIPEDPDLVKVVRCKGCIYYEKNFSIVTNGITKYRCEKHGAYFPNEGFCCYGRINSLL